MTPRLRPSSSGRPVLTNSTSFRDVGVSGGTGTNTRTGWRALDSRLQARRYRWLSSPPTESDAGGWTP